MPLSPALRRFTAVPLLALLLASTTVTPTRAVDGPDLTQPFAIATDGSAPLVAAPSPDGRHLYVTNQKSRTITIIEISSSTQVGSIAGQHRQRDHRRVRRDRLGDPAQRRQGRQDHRRPLGRSDGDVLRGRP
ncbi:hypothetical protein [Aeromicrobium sp. UC242_57]|uniref:hypothetical protein n=1 Tax=Aeromicrobium sp. UC242_57 TaxID=3374624 RepID=UPI0037B509F0